MYVMYIYIYMYILCINNNSWVYARYIMTYTYIYIFLIIDNVCKCEKMIQAQQAAEAPTYSPCFPVQGLVPVCPGSL